MKRIRFEPNVPAEVRSIEQQTALQILTALHRYAETGVGSVKPLRGDFEGFAASPCRRPPRPKSQGRLPPRRDERDADPKIGPDFGSNVFLAPPVTAGAPTEFTKP